MIDTNFFVLGRELLMNSIAWRCRFSFLPVKDCLQPALKKAEVVTVGPWVARTS
jgi:hypothetical protein